MKIFKFQHSEDFGHNVLILFGNFKKVILAQVKFYNSVFWRFPDISIALNLFDGSVAHFHFGILGQSLDIEFGVYSSYYLDSIK